MSDHPSPATRESSVEITFGDETWSEVAWPSDGRYDIGYQLAHPVQPPGRPSYMGLFERKRLSSENADEAFERARYVMEAKAVGAEPNPNYPRVVSENALTAPSDVAVAHAHNIVGLPVLVGLDKVPVGAMIVAEELLRLALKITRPAGESADVQASGMESRAAAPQAETSKEDGSAVAGQAPAVAALPLTSAGRAPLAKELCTAASIGMTTIIVWSGAYETLNPYMKRQFDTLSNLHKLACEHGVWDK